jgi:UDP-N-acetylmuramate--alanine ligase
MSALARYFKGQGKYVSGYDRSETELTRQLVREGIPIHYTDSIAQAPKDTQLVVYTPAIPEDHQELTFYRLGGYEVQKRSEVLGWITRSSFNVCVGGTHGKTTVSTLIAHLLRASGRAATAFLGGISVNYQSNFWSDGPDLCVVEADEYDRSFLRLNPDIAVITAMDADHLDIYGTEESLRQAYVDFALRVKPGGMLIYKSGLEVLRKSVGSKKADYGLMDQNADWHAAEVRIEEGSYRFDVVAKEGTLRGLSLGIGGMHNVENAVAAIAVARQLGLQEKQIKEAIGSFRGVRRRFEYIIAPGKGKPEGPVFIDDYAHHPEELRALISSARSLFPGLPCTVVFQPHLYSRTRDLAAGFAESLDLADEVILLPVYPARELAIPGVSSELILKRMKRARVVCLGKEDAIDELGNRKIGLLITAGAGDIDALVEPLRQNLERTNP